MKTAAITCKVLAILIWLGSAWFVLNFHVRDLRSPSPPYYRDAPVDWGTPAYLHRTCFHIAETALLTLLALVPNRILVSSRIAFGISLAAALIPLRIVFATDLSFGGIGEALLSVFVVAMMAGMLDRKSTR